MFVSPVSVMAPVTLVAALNMSNHLIVSSILGIPNWGLFDDTLLSLLGHGLAALGHSLLF
jgi:hypothetical protein